MNGIWMGDYLGHTDLPLVVSVLLRDGPRCPLTAVVVVTVRDFSSPPHEARVYGLTTTPRPRVTETRSRALDSEEASLWPVSCQALHNSPCRTRLIRHWTPCPRRGIIAAHPTTRFCFMQLCAPPLPDLLPNNYSEVWRRRPPQQASLAAWATC